MVKAHDNLRGSCKQEHDPVEEDQFFRIGTMGTEPSNSVGPQYLSNKTVTAVGSEGGLFPF